MSSGCGTIGSADTSDNRGIGFELQSSATFIEQYLQLTVCRKDLYNEKSFKNKGALIEWL